VLHSLVTAGRRRAVRRASAEGMPPCPTKGITLPYEGLPKPLDHRDFALYMILQLTIPLLLPLRLAMVMPAFQRFPNEAAIIGRLLAGYAELEIALLHCVSMARGDFDATLKAMFRIRGETSRINVADALGRQLYHKLGLRTDFEIAVSAMRYCLKIRNQYAHCNWYDDNSGRLAFVNVEEIANDNQPILGFEGLTRHYIDAPTLEEQEQYFGYTDALLNYANYEGRFKIGTLNTRMFEKPTQIGQPSLHIP
jgi:hypothetical protein